MPAHRPEELDLLLAEGSNAGQVDPLVALYEPEAVLICSGQVATGTHAIREVFRARGIGHPSLRLQVKTIAQAGDMALTSAKWDALGPDGSPIDSIYSVEVSRRQADGTWRFVIDVMNLEWLKRTDT